MLRNNEKSFCPLVPPPFLTTFCRPVSLTRKYMPAPSVQAMSMTEIILATRMRLLLLMMDSSCSSS